MPDAEAPAGPVLDLLLETPLVKDRSGASLQRQLHQRIRGAILDGRFPSGCRLPGSRALATALGISRNSVTAVYDLLGAEGYITPSRQGTRVSALERPASRPRAARQAASPPVARRAARIRDSALNAADNLPLRPGVPALARFPLSAWKHCLDRAVRQAGPSGLWYGDPLGEPALRAAIMRHLAVARGVRCEHGQIVITEGAQEALTLCVRLVTNPGDTAWIEDPGYRGAKTAMLGGDLDVIPMRVDDSGLSVPERAWTTQTPRLVYTSPSHQYPTGAVLTAARRLDLIDRAQRHGAWIIEDDYDSEFRFTGRPIPCLQGLESDAPVIYLGTFSKTMYPGLRLAYLVLPKRLVKAFQAAHAELYREGHLMTHAAVAAFISEGHYAAHVRRMRMLYGRRRAMLVNLIERRLGVDWLHRDSSDAGLHLVLDLPDEIPDEAVVQAAHARGVLTRPLSRYYDAAPQGGEPPRQGLLLGYACVPEADIARKFEVLLDSLAYVARQRKRP